MNLGEAQDLHAVLRAVFVDGTPEALAAAHPVAVRLVERTWRALSASGRPYLRLSEITGAAPSAPAETATDHHEPAGG